MKKRTLFKICLCSVPVLLLVLALWALDLPHWQKLDLNRLEAVPETVIYDGDGALAASLTSVHPRVRIELSQLPAYVPQAFVAAEDARFYEHRGVDLNRIAGALWHDLTTFSFSQGASTITQQLVKLTHLSSEKTLSRKVQEIVLALRLERRLSKGEILEAYLNTVYFGRGAYGIGAAAQAYFGKSATDLSLAEAAMLAGIIKSPSHYAPHLDWNAARTRQKYVLSAMAENGYVTEPQANRAYKEKLTLATGTEDVTGRAWYLDECAREACELMEIGMEELLTGGYSIYTALKEPLQDAAVHTMETGDFYPDEAAQGACAVMDPKTGEIVAVVGGRTCEVRMGLNRATMSRRQPGSLIKPVSTYAASVDRYSYLPTSIVYDVQRNYPGGYSPGNSGGTFHGEVTVREALSRSYNAAAVDLADTAGIATVAGYARRFGIPVAEEDVNLALALGSMTYGASPAEFCAAYCALANGGVWRKAHCVRRIVDRNGREIYRYQDDPQQAIRAESAYLITDILKTAAQTGTAKALASLDFPIAAKTGTAGLENGDTSDAWTTAYTPDLAVTVWIGRDDMTGGGMARSVTGGGTAAHACAQFLAAIEDRLSKNDFDRPAGIQPRLVDGYLLETENRVALAAENTPAAYLKTEFFPISAPDPERSEIWGAPLPVTDLSCSESEGFPELTFTSRSDLAEYLLLRSDAAGSREIAVLSGEDGTEIRYRDETADPSQTYSYSVVPRHRLLYENGTLLTGEVSSPVAYPPSGALDRLADLLSSETPSPAPEILTNPLL